MLKRSLLVFVSLNKPQSLYLVQTALLCLMLVAASNSSFAQTNTGDSRPQLVPNGRRYKETGLKPATGRSGSASLTARALVGKDGATTLEMSTGQLDTYGTPPGNINRAQIKPLNENGEPLNVRNFNGSGRGYFQTSVNDLYRGQQVQMQAIVDGIDGNRTNVVTLIETVKLRPDISPIELSAPTRGVARMPVNIGVVLRELRGDSGSTSDLVLYEDGIAVDRANQIWIDAAGTVSCLFTHTFNSVGTKQLTVKVEGMAPGDYDLSNNTIEGSIVIEPPPSVQLNYNFQVVDGDDDYRAHVYEKRYLNGVLDVEHEEDFSSRGWQQLINFYGWSGRMITFPITISHQETNDGEPAFSNTHSNLMPTNVIDASDGVTRFISYNVWRYDSSTAYYFNLYTNATINLATGARTETTFFSSNRQAGDVTYYSAGYERFWDGKTGEEFFYSWNTTDVNRAGWRIPIGSRYGVNVSLTTGDGTVLTASPEAAMSTFDNSGQQPAACFDWNFDPYSGTSCVSYQRTWTGKRGYAYLNTNP